MKGTIPPPPRATLQPVGQDLTALALAGRFVPLVGRKAEVARMDEDGGRPPDAPTEWPHS